MFATICRVLGSTPRNMCAHEHEHTRRWRSMTEKGAHTREKREMNKYQKIFLPGPQRTEPGQHLLGSHQWQCLLRRVSASVSVLSLWLLSPITQRWEPTVYSRQGRLFSCTRKDTHAVIPVGPAPRWWLSWRSDSIFCCCWRCGFSSSVILRLKCTGIRTARRSSNSESPFRFLGHLAFKTGKPMTLCKEMLPPRPWLKTRSVSISYEMKLGLDLCSQHKLHSDFIFSFCIIIRSFWWHRAPFSFICFSIRRKLTLL